jgi:subtilase family serine protease
MRPAWATTDRYVSDAASTETVSLQVHLKMRNEDQARAQLLAIDDPDSATFGQYMSEDDFVAQYAPTESDVAAVRAHLEKHGLTIGEIPSNRMYVAAQGTASQVQAAFATRLGHYQVGGQLRRAPVDTPRMPPSFASRISGALGLAESPKYAPHPVRVGGVKQNSMKPNDVAPGTCSEFWNQIIDTTDPPFGGGYPATPPYATCGYTPPQLRRAYGFSDTVRAGNDGTGVSIAIVDAFHSPTLLSDAQTYAAQHDADYPLQTSQFTAYDAPGTNPPPPPDPSWFLEQALDVEAVHTMAPGANIVFVGAASPSDTDLVSAIDLIITKDLAGIVSNSYGSPEGQANDFVIWEAIATHAGLKGVGLYFSSGDNGDESQNLGFPSPDFPASLPNVTSVGATSLALDQNDARVFEVGWETGASFLTAPAPAPAADGGTGGTDDAGAGDAGPPAATWQPPPPGFFAFGAGGGTSFVFTQPAYQAGVVPDALANIPGAPARVVPDVAMLGDPITGMLIGVTQNGTYGESPVGGTSLACPLFAASMGLAQQHGGRRLGFANAQLYKKRATALTDIVPGASLQSAAIPGGIMTDFEFPGLAIQTAVGYDNVTGLGTANGKAFLNAIK